VVLLIEQQFQVFLSPALIGRAGLDSDKALLFDAGGLELGFFAVEALQFALSLF
jgi:hypothetical protein